MFSIHGAPKTKREYGPGAADPLYPHHAEPWIPRAIEEICEAENWGNVVEDLTEWEHDFANEIGASWKKYGHLTYHQFHKLVEIMDKVEVYPEPWCRKRG